MVDSARLLGCVQTPAVYGSIHGAPTLPRLTPGQRYASAFPGRVRPPATTEWDSLLPYGIDEDVLARWKSAMLTGLNELQLRAINEHGVLDGRSLVVVAPTSSGKTMIGELAAVREAKLGGRAVVLLPLRALVNDKYAYFSDLYRDRLEVVRATGEHSDQVDAVYQGQYDLALLTYEKFLNIVTADPWVLRGVSLAGLKRRSRHDRVNCGVGSQPPGCGVRPRGGRSGRGRRRRSGRRGRRPAAGMGRAGRGR